MIKGRLSTSDGQIFEGRFHGRPITSSGELVFTTGMVGYTESLTDPSYFGQILIFTYPLIGNYGVPQMSLAGSPSAGFESNKAHVAGVILSTDSLRAFHWNSKINLVSWLNESGVPVLTGIDTRYITLLFQNRSRLLARIDSSDDVNVTDTDFFDPNEQNVLPSVSLSEKRIFGRGRKRVALLDCGVKWSIVRELTEHDCEVQILPWNSHLASVDCDYFVISNGPGNPRNAESVIKNLKEIIEEDRPILGICLGNQLLALAAGASTLSMAFGHRGLNHPVVEVGTKRGFITSQNHGYEIDRKSLPKDWELWFVNANDGSVEGIRHSTKPFWGIQFHPEASPGPWDTKWIFRKFLDLRDKL